MNGPFGTEAILVVEDEDPLRELTGRLLKRAGYEVSTACNGNEALRQYKENEGKFSLLLTDFVMPGMNGKELAERLEALNPNLKVLFISGYLDDIVFQLGTKIHFLAKPFTSSDLLKEVRAVLDEGRVVSEELSASIAQGKLA